MNLKETEEIGEKEGYASRTLNIHALMVPILTQSCRKRNVTNDPRGEWQGVREHFEKVTVSKITLLYVLLGLYYQGTTTRKMFCAGEGQAKAKGQIGEGQCSGFNMYRNSIILRLNINAHDLNPEGRQYVKGV